MGYECVGDTRTRQEREIFGSEFHVSGIQKEVGIETACSLIRIAQGILKAELGEVIDLLCSALVVQGHCPDCSQIRGINRDGVDGGVNGIIAAAAGQRPVLFDCAGSDSLLGYL